MDFKTGLKIGLVLILLIGSAFAGYSYADQEADHGPTEVDLPEREGPVGTVIYDCGPESCDVTVSVDEWRQYESFAVQNVTGTVADTYYLHPNDSSATIEDVPRGANGTHNVALYVPVQNLSPTDHVWNRYYSNADGKSQSFNVVVDRDYRIFL